MASSVVASQLSASWSLQSICGGSLSVKSVGAAMATTVPARNSRGVCCALQHEEHCQDNANCGRREAVVSGMAALIAGLSVVAPAFADFDEDYKIETQAVIERVKNTLALEKTDPSKADAVANLRQSSNDWVAKYRREKSVAGRPSFSNMYSVLNAISGHYISFGPNYPIPVKRKDRILEEIRDAEKALKRGR